MLQVNIQSYELQNNKWQTSVVHINQTWCDFITSDPYFMEGIIRQSNYPDKCPITAVSSHFSFCIASNDNASKLKCLLP